MRTKLFEIYHDGKLVAESPLMVYDLEKAIAACESQLNRDDLSDEGTLWIEAVRNLLIARHHPIPGKNAAAIILVVNFWTST